MRQAVHDTLAELIADGSLTPGQHLVESDLAEQLGVSRQPIREALQRLSFHHFAETQQQLPDNHRGKLPALLAVVAHPFAMLAMSLPWSALALLTFWRGFADLWDERGKLLLQALHCWTWPNLLFWSLLPDHSPRYSLPLLPGISGRAISSW